jgi:hypothetical protein
MQFEEEPKDETDANAVKKSDPAPIAGTEQTAWTDQRNEAVKSSSMSLKPVKDNREGDGANDVTQESVKYASAVNF